MREAVYSTTEQLQRIAAIIKCCCRLPVSKDSVPGGFLETVFAHVRHARVLPNYDYVDVVDDSNRIGWSIKSTKAGSPLTWKRAKPFNQTKLISDSQGSKEGLQQLGNALIDICNKHAKESMSKYHLAEIGYCRLIVHKSRQVTYFERKLCDLASPSLFNPDDFEWDWSVEKATKGKEQRSSLHGWHKTSGMRWWAWHGKGENQLHFSAEQKVWWPSDDQHKLEFTLPDSSSKLSFERLLEVLSAA